MNSGRAWRYSAKRAREIQIIPSIVSPISIL
jgi:hypothetical protein